MLAGLDTALGRIVSSLDTTQPFSQVVAEDVDKTRKALTLVLAQPRISSELVDKPNSRIWAPLMVLPAMRERASVRPLMEAPLLWLLDT